MTTLLLIDPYEHEIAAVFTEQANEKKVVVYNSMLIHSIKTTGIAVPGGFAGMKHKTHYIYLNAEPNLFARAFREEYYPHGLMQQGYYWVKKEDYTGPEGEYQKALKFMMGAFKKE
jgi:hypothetical protein